MKDRLILRAAFVAVLLATPVPVSFAARDGDDLHMKGVVTRSGRPVRSAWVVVTKNGDEKGRSLTGDDGKYYIGELGAGEYEVVVEQGPRKTFAGHVSLPEASTYNIEVTRR